MNPNGYILSFSITRGDTRNVNPTGPIAHIPYSYKITFINTSQSSFNGTFLANNNPTIVQGIFALNIQYTDNGIQLLYNGIYDLKYGISIQIPTATDTNPFTITVTTRINDSTPAAPTSLQLQIKDNSYHLITNSVLTGFFFQNENPPTIEMLISAD